MGKIPKTRSGRSASPLWPGFKRSPVAVPASKFLGDSYFDAKVYPAPILPQDVGNIRVLLVGPPDQLDGLRQYTRRFSLVDGFPTEFPTISDAMDAIPLLGPDDNWFVNRWAILVTPGFYREEVRMKPSVTIMGLVADTVFICPPEKGRSTLKRKDGSRARATVYMNHFTSIRNVGIAKPAYSLNTDYAIWNKDTYDLKHKRTEPPGKEDVSDFSAFDVNIWPFFGKDDFDKVGSKDDKKRNNETHGEFVMGKSILMEGNFSTTFMVNVGSSYNYRRSFDFEIKGEGQNADCHIVDCFFDSLFLDRGEALDEGGCIDVSNCFEVHIRNSFLRVGANPADKDNKNKKTLGAAVRVRGNAMALLEGSTLTAPGMESTRVLHVDPPKPNKIAGCIFSHSSTDSVDGKQWVTVKQGLP
jgi:hypothetical protein